MHLELLLKKKKIRFLFELNWELSGTYVVEPHVVLYLVPVHVPLKLVHELQHHGHHFDSVRHALSLVPFPIFVVRFPFVVDFCPAICPVI